MLKRFVNLSVPLSPPSPHPILYISTFFSTVDSVDINYEGKYFSMRFCDWKFLVQWNWLTVNEFHSMVSLSHSLTHSLSLAIIQKSSKINWKWRGHHIRGRWKHIHWIRFWLIKIFCILSKSVQASVQCTTLTTIKSIEMEFLCIFIINIKCTIVFDHKCIFNFKWWTF